MERVEELKHDLQDCGSGDTRQNRQDISTDDEAAIGALMGEVAGDAPRRRYRRRVGGSHEFVPGSTGVRLDGDLTQQDKARVFTEELTQSPKWKEEWVIVKRKAYADVDEALEHAWSADKNTLSSLVDSLASGVTYYTTDFRYDYLVPPGQSEIDALSDTIWGAAHLVSTDGSATGRMFREDLSSSSTYKYRDHWVLAGSYKGPDSSGNNMVLKREAGGPVDLKSFLDDAKNNDPGSNWKWYVQVTYSLTEKTA